MSPAPRDFQAAIHFVERHVLGGRGDRVAYVHDGGTTTYGALAAPGLTPGVELVDPSVAPHVGGRPRCAVAAASEHHRVR